MGLAIALIATAAGVAACGSSDSSSGSTGTATSASPPAPAKFAGPPEVSSIRVGVTPATGFAPTYIGATDGSMDKLGLKVAATPLNSGSAAVAQLASGDLQIAATNLTTVAYAVAQGLDLSVIADTVVATPDDSSVEVLPTSTIKTPQDLVGKKIGVSSLKNTGIYLNADLQAAGIDYSTIQYVEVPSANFGPALQKGTVDAVVAVQPLSGVLRQTLHTRKVVDVEAGKAMEGMPMAGYVVLSSFAKKNPKTVAAFQCGLLKAAKTAVADPSVVRASLPAFTGITKAAAATTFMPTFSPGLDLATVNKPVDVLNKQHELSKPVNLAATSVPTPTDCPA